MSPRNDGVHHRTVAADGVEVFYRDAGDPSLPIILLVHGFGASSHQFRNLMPRLSPFFRTIAPDLPGFGFTRVASGLNYAYSFAALAETLTAFVAELKLRNYLLYIFDYGAPVGLRHALACPGNVAGLISQNGNAYLEGLSQAWDPIQAYWRSEDETLRESIAEAILSPAGIRWQYEHGVADPSLIAPETYTLASLLIEKPGNRDIQLDLIKDYASNLDLYPRFQSFFRQYSFPVLIIWGKNDPFFLPEGAHAYARDIPGAYIELLDAGHFALETHCEHIASRIIQHFSNFEERLPAA